MNEFLNIDPSLLKYIQESLAQVNQVLKAFQNSFNKTIDELKKMPESTRFLADQGWYLPLSVTPFQVSELINTNNSDILDRKMMLLIDNEINYIESELTKKFPNRKNPIQSGIRAHRNKEYYLSIPVFFAQIEGICKELTGLRFFATRNGEPKTELWATDINQDSILNLFLEPLRIIGKTREKQNPENPLGINRHDVLHGDSIDYGESGINSYKALSLLNYMSETVFKAKQFLKNPADDLGV